jgi:hypothetical protein
VRRPERGYSQAGHQNERSGDDTDALAGAELAPDFGELLEQFGEILIHLVPYICIRMIS